MQPEWAPTRNYKMRSNVVLGLLGTEISARISALAMALPSAFHGYRLSLTNHSIRSFRMTAAEGGKARAVPRGSKAVPSS